MKQVSILIACIWLASTGMHAQAIVMDSLAMQSLAMDSVEADSVAASDTIELVLLVDDMANAIVHQDSLVRRLMEDKVLGIQRGKNMVEGYRVQVYSSNQQQVAKNEALLLQQELESQLDMPVYALSEPPFWKVRIGNFLTREEANIYRAAIVELFPKLQGSTYVVPDNVIITH